MSDTQLVEHEFSNCVGQLFRGLNLLNRDQKVCYGLTLSQCYTIESLAQKGLVSMNDLSRLQGVTISTMTRVIDVLVRDGIVERIASPEDRRKVCIQLSEKGKDVAEKLQKCTEEYTRQIFLNIPADQREHIIESMQFLCAAIEQVSKRCCVIQ